MEEPTTKTMADRKTDILEIIVNSPVGIDKPMDELIEILEKSADFVFSYQPPKLSKQNGA